MCMMLYIASDKELPLVELNTDKNHFILVDNLHESCRGVNKQFTKKYVYYIGSYQGCGCGFQYEDKVLDPHDLSDEDIEEDIEDQKNRKNSVKELFDYIRENIKDVGEIELYSCWADNEEGTPEHITEIDLSKFSLGDSFRFEENELIKVKERL